MVVAGGARPQDVAQIAFGYGLPTGAFGLHAGLERIGATVIPASTGNTKRQLVIMKDYQTSVLVCTPSYALFIAETAREPASTSPICTCASASSAPSRGPTRPASRSSTAWD